MRIHFVKPEVREGKKYRGEISRFTLDATHKIFRVYVILDQEPQLEFMKRFEVEQNTDSAFATFCREMGIYTEDDTAELDELEGTRVIVKLKRGREEKLFIEKIQLDEKYYEEHESDEE